MRITRGTVLALIALLVCAGAASAEDPYYEDGTLDDSVTGTDRPGGDRWAFDAHSNTDGGNPRGSIDLVNASEPEFTLTAEVTCLSVTGNRAVIGAFNRKYSLPSIWVVEDHGPGKADSYGMTAGIDTSGYSCTNPPPDLPMARLTDPGADLVVADDRPVPVSSKASRCGTTRRKRCAQTRKAKASCMRKARKAPSRAKVKRRVRACRRAGRR